MAIATTDTLFKVRVCITVRIVAVLVSGKAGHGGGSEGSNEHRLGEHVDMLF